VQTVDAEARLHGVILGGGRAGTGGPGGLGGDASLERDDCQAGAYGGNGGNGGAPGSWFGALGAVDLHAVSIFVPDGHGEGGEPGGIGGSNPCGCWRSHADCVSSRDGCNGFPPENGRRSREPTVHRGAQVTHDGAVVRLCDIVNEDQPLAYPIVGVRMTSPTGILEGCRIWLRSTATVVGALLEGQNAARLNTVVVTGARTSYGLQSLADSIGGFAGNAIVTSPGGVCIADDARVRDEMVGNALWGCDAAQYLGPDGIIMGVEGLDAIEARTHSGENVVADPLFRDREAGDFSPDVASPLLDAFPLDVNLGVDVVGARRPQGDAVDIGALEYPEDTCGDDEIQPGEMCDGIECTADCRRWLNRP